LSKTHGEKAGVNLDISELEEEMELAVSTATSPLLKLLSKYQILSLISRKIYYVIL
jgi:hypothetical protein